MKNRFSLRLMMISCFYRRLLAFVCVLSFSAVAAAQPLNWFWWKSEPSLALTSEQSTQIDAIFQEGIGRLMQQKDELDRLEGKLSRLIETMATEDEVTRQIDRVEAVRSTLNKTRTLMLLHMRQVLKPEQRLKLNALRDRRVQEQRQRDNDKAGASSGVGKRSDGSRKPLP
jgi:Spy/CpxP family protein refolding chaperone